MHLQHHFRDEILNQRGIPVYPVDHSKSNEFRIFYFQVKFEIMGKCQDKFNIKGKFSKTERFNKF